MSSTEPTEPTEPYPTCADPEQVFHWAQLRCPPLPAWHTGCAGSTGAVQVSSSFVITERTNDVITIT